jgi:hypothetical protein
MEGYPQGQLSIISFIGKIKRIMCIGQKPAGCRKKGLYFTADL